ncbi:hypothetical protein [Rubinisphaera margarita]|uniref:hypothetical protein n=1 Tax=Rubinisphaera margarita TaxID=2909586 RepID=UPI001EE8CA97|nr:hypothetical protein [Rubinisphaera margarita]MCG6155747.1 hypothetical protein [Rubinisphaera margarita]
MRSKKLKSEYVTEWTTGENARGTRSAESSGAYCIEKELATHLNSLAGLDFDSLVVRRLGNSSLCLEGTMRTDDAEFDLSDYVRCALGIDGIVNRVVTQPRSRAGEETSYAGEDTVVDWC